MDDSKVEDCVVCLTLGVNGSRIAYEQFEALWRIPNQPRFGLINHLGIKIKGMHFSRTKALENDPGSDAAPASDFKHAQTFRAPAKPLQKWRFVPALQ